MNILITGGAGYIGAELVNQLLLVADADTIVIYDNLARKNYNFFAGYKFENKAKIKFVEGDLLDSRKLRAALKNVDVVFHLAALTDKNPSLDSHLFEQVNHWGTSELMNAIEESKVSRVIYLSSVSVYGGGNEIFHEASPINPLTFYAISKWRGEEQVKRLFTKKNCSIVRVGNVYGYTPCLRFDGVVNKFMFDANFKGRLQIHGNGRQLRSYIHINKVVKSLIGLLHTDESSTIYNLSDKNMQVLDIVEVLQEIYPALEFIFINQHLKIEDLQIDVENKLGGNQPQPTDFLEEMKDFQSKLSF